MPINFKERHQVKRFIVPLLLLAVMLAVLPIAALHGVAETGTEQGEGSAAESEIPDDTLVTYGYLKQLREQLKKEIIAELTASGGITVDTVYNEVVVKEGEIILLSSESELIYRGGGAVAITSSNKEGEGITDMSGNTEIFSGEALEYGHIYFSSASQSKKAVLVTGASAYFTIRGSYEIV